MESSADNEPARSPMLLAERSPNELVLDGHHPPRLPYVGGSGWAHRLHLHARVASPSGQAFRAQRALISWATKAESVPRAWPAFL